MKRFQNIQKVIARSSLCWMCLLGLSLVTSPVVGQVFDLGPSDSALFDIVINVPDDPDFGDQAFVGGDGLTTQLNISDGFSFGSPDGSFADGSSVDSILPFTRFDAFSGSEVNISGGSVAGLFFANPGSEVNVSGGVVGQSVLSIGGFATGTGSVLNISGGNVFGPVTVGPRGKINISGGMVSGDFFSTSSDSELNISGGSVLPQLSARGEVNISGGTLVGEFDAELGSVINISGGAVSRNFDARSGSEVNISGGSVGSRFDALPGSDVELIGGDFELNGAAFSGASITLATDDIFTGTLADGSTFIFSEALADNLSNVTLTLEALPPLDLTPVVVATADLSRPSGLRAGQMLTLISGGELGENFEVIDAVLNVEGGQLGSEAGALRSEVNISGGSVGGRFDAGPGSVVNISGGSVGFDFDAGSDSVVNISGGEVGDFSDAFSGSVVNISGGSVGSNFRASSGSEVNISGGLIGNAFNATSGSVVNISGGTLDPDFERVALGQLAAFSGSEVNLFGSDFVLDGVPLDDSLIVDEALTIVDRDDAILTGVLADGEPFSFVLDSDSFNGSATTFETDATLTVTLVSSITLGDVNQDGVANFQDISPFIAALSFASPFIPEADCNQDGAVNFLDITFFIAILSGE